MVHFALLVPVRVQWTHQRGNLAIVDTVLHKRELPRCRVIKRASKGFRSQRLRHAILQVGHEALVLRQPLLLSLSQDFLRVHNLRDSLHVSVQVLYPVFVLRVD